MDKIASALLAACVLGAAAGYQYYLDTDYYRSRFEPKFRSLKAGDSYQRMLDLLGDPTHSCRVRVKDGFSSGADTLAIRRMEIFRIADYDYMVHFEKEVPGPGDPITALEVGGRMSFCKGIKFG